MGVTIYLFSRRKALKKTRPVAPKNKYIEIHEKKIIDDTMYNDYLEWCKAKGEIAVDKEGYDEHRMKEYMMYKKLMKFGIKKCPSTTKPFLRT